MFGSQVLDAVIGLVFVYLLLSVICTAVNESIAGLLSLRGRTLAKGIANLFADKRVTGLEELFFDHPLIRGLCRGGRKPSYIPSRTFAMAFLDGIAPAGKEGPGLLSDVRDAVKGLPDDSEMRRVLLLLLQDAGDDVDKFRSNVETWFNDAMTRVSGWYKRKSQVITFVSAVLIAVITNADTLDIVGRLAASPAVRVALSSQAQEFSGRQTPLQSATERKNSAPAVDLSGAAPAVSPPSQGQAEAAALALRNTGIPFGWRSVPAPEEWGNKLIGLLLTAFAVSLGAPVWFDLLSKVTRLRSAGSVPGKDGEKTAST